MIFSVEGIFLKFRIKFVFVFFYLRKILWEYVWNVGWGCGWVVVMEYWFLEGSSEDIMYFVEINCVKICDI